MKKTKKYIYLCRKNLIDKAIKQKLSAYKFKEIYNTINKIGSNDD